MDRETFVALTRRDAAPVSRRVALAAQLEPRFTTCAPA